MRTKSAILVELNRPLEIVELETPTLKAGQVLVRLAYSGVCHTQLLEAFGHRGEDKFLPHCLGHEGSGTVVETGAEVTKVKPGDSVIVSWIKGSGRDIPGCVYSWEGRAVNSGAVTTFGEYSVVSENRLTVIAADYPKREAALIGCAVPTGVGVILNTAEARAGQSVAVIGAGGIGLCAVAGAKAAGCVPIIAVDINAAKLEAASRMGATHVINASSTDLPAEIQGIAPGGVDIAIEATGRPTAMAQALACVRSQGGIAVIAGNAHLGESIALDPRQLNQGKQLRGTWGGDNSPDRDYPRYLKLIGSGRLDLSPLIEREYPLDQVNEALADLRDGRALRPMIKLSPE